MARKAVPQTPPVNPQLLVSREEAAQKIGDRIKLGQELYNRAISSLEQLETAESDYSRWDSYNTEMLQHLFSTHKFADEYSWWGIMSVGLDESPAQKLTELKKGVEGKIHRLESVRDRLDLIQVAGVVRPRQAGVPERSMTNRVFVVHGHDEAARESVARFLERLGIEAVILHEQATGGRTIVEKLEHYADVDFAVVLLTPDDIGGVKGAASEKLQPRARQNVMLELGYFVGRLTRKHVCALYKGPLELPSDYFGVGYVALDDAGAWRLELAKELRSAGFTVDMNLVI